MRAYALKVAYDGTNFLGYQRQRSGRTVQGVLEHALGVLTGETARDLGAQVAGRTDTGVHATGQVVSFRSHRDWPASQWVRALNGVLPSDMAIQGAAKVPSSFQPRRHATSRTYRYYVLVKPTPSPLARLTHFRLSALTHQQEMFDAWKGIVGTHDFQAFRSTGSSPRDTIVTVSEATVTASEPEIIFGITALSYLYHMVRRLVGAALAVGRGKVEGTDFCRYLVSRGDGLPPAPTAPAHGLVLSDITYPPPLRWEV